MGVDAFSLAASDALHARAAAFVEAFERDLPAPEPFDRLACDLVRHQAASGYARLAASHGRDLAALARTSEIPAIPTDAFKHARIAAHPPALDTAIFRTSGTTLGARGTHALRHTLACRLVNQGVSIKEVADVLRHRSLNTSMIYAKLDHGALAGVALPWPGSAQ